ncbi:hypothetical protein GCM10009127_25090 [Alteraurantiacibacter aestuarii]|uniref:hypothetical protein n=1 Tax=Alteraurantiacibacter aestuarii TaxID=650004 RepID=UPI0031D9D099
MNFSKIATLKLATSAAALFVLGAGLPLTAFEASASAAQQQQGQGGSGQGGQGQGGQGSQGQGGQGGQGQGAQGQGAQGQGGSGAGGSQSDQAGSDSGQSSPGQGSSGQGSQGQGSSGQGSQSGQSGRSGNAGSGASQPPRGLDDILRDISTSDEDEDSDRPAWAGGGGGPNDRGGKPSTAGSARGDLYGDLYVILRDDNGVPILTDEGFVQPIDADGNPIPLDEEGAPIDPSLAMEVELGRLNVGRSPNSVLDNRAQEVIDMLNDADALSLDAAGRLVITIDGVAKTIDSPLENLAIYVALMTQGTIPDVADLPGEDFDHLIDGVFTVEDLASAASFLAAASDKAGELTTDEVAYINAFLGINTTSAGNVTWTDMDFSEFVYDRSDTYENVTVTVLVQQGNNWVPTVVNVYEVLFNSTDFSNSGTLEAFAQAAEDARAVIEYIHEYEVPVEQL